MREELESQAAAALRQLAAHLPQWRQSRTTPRGPRIPAPLWAAAVRLAPVLPLTRVANQLGLKPQALKRRRGNEGRAAGPPPLPSTPQFVALPPGAWRPSTTAVEIQRPAGARLRIPYSEASPALAPLLQTFLEHR